MPVFRLPEELAFPAPHLARPDGLLAVGGDLSPPRLLLAYACGIFPWFGEDDPILWHAPPERMVLPVQALRVNRSTRKAVRRGFYRVTRDTAFAEVVHACATVERPGQEQTWITAEMQTAYAELHALGFAHSVESWRGEELVGGLYGVSLGAAFFGESMFSRADNASKVAFVHLVESLRQWGFHFIDAQMHTPLLASFGATEVPRERYEEMLARALAEPSRRGPWT